jgi:hypothetical protein
MNDQPYLNSNILMKIKSKFKRKAKESKKERKEKETAVGPQSPYPCWKTEAVGDFVFVPPETKSFVF